MKGRIELGEFIHEVKRELILAQRKEETPFYALEEVELEVSFVLDATGKAKGSLFVVELEGETKASQTHKVKLLFKPLNITDKKPAKTASPDVGSGRDRSINTMLYE